MLTQTAPNANAIPTLMQARLLQWMTQAGQTVVAHGPGPTYRLARDGVMQLHFTRQHAHELPPPTITTFSPLQHAGWVECVGYGTMGFIGSEADERFGLSDAGCEALVRGYTAHAAYFEADAVRTALETEVQLAAMRSDTAVTAATDADAAFQSLGLQLALGDATAPTMETLRTTAVTMHARDMEARAAEDTFRTLTTELREATRVVVRLARAEEPPRTILGGR